MSDISQRLSALFQDVDAANADDPRTVLVDGESRSYEQVYSSRMLAALNSLYPDASDLLKLAAYAQHIRRWDIPRADYPEGKVGYNNWRKAARDHHATLIAQIMAKHGFSDDEAERVGALIKKEKLKKDDESQALENVVAVTFLQHYWDGFVQEHQDYDDNKLINILGKTLRKMSSKGHEAALALPLSDQARALLERAIDQENKAPERPGDSATD